ncbi:hypothetical protein BGX30_001459 [Mortierella sp. GBA39]|nr:hypothetical protein BGX30_001459 [Mortierella sp. GBA39]
MSDISLSSLPSEIVQLIADRLSQQSLAQCSLVCHAWHSTFESSFWRSVQLLSYIRFDNPSPSLEALTRNLHHIRQLAISEPTLIHHFAFHQSALSQLQVLKLYLFGSKSSFFSTTESPDMARGNNTRAISRILEGCHNLQVLDLWITDYFQQAGKTVGFQEIMSACPTGSLKSIILLFEQDPIYSTQAPSQSVQEY